MNFDYQVKIQRMTAQNCAFKIKSLKECIQEYATKTCIQFYVLCLVKLKLHWYIG